MLCVARGDVLYRDGPGEEEEFAVVVLGGRKEGCAGDAQLGGREK